MIKYQSAIDNIPTNVPILPFSEALLLPKAHRPLNIFEKCYIALIDEAMAKDRLVGVILPKDQKSDSELFEIGCLGKITHFEEISPTNYFIILSGLIRFELGKEISDRKALFRRFNINISPFLSDLDLWHKEEGEIRGFDRNYFLNTLRSYAEYADIELDWEEIEQTSNLDLINLTSMLAPFNDKEQQLLLEAETPLMRSEIIIALAELEMAKENSGIIIQ